MGRVLVFSLVAPATPGIHPSPQAGTMRIAAVTVYGFRISLGGQLIFGEGSLEE